MEEYIGREDLLAYARSIRPFESDYFGTGSVKRMVLDKAQDIADELERLPFVKIDMERNVWHTPDNDLPPVGQDVLVETVIGVYLVAHMSELYRGRWEYTDFKTDEEVKIAAPMRWKYI